MALASLLCLGADPAPSPGQVERSVSCSYVVRDQDTLSGILYRIGLGNRTYRLYGKRGWLIINEQENPRVKDWMDLAIGTTLILKVPPELWRACMELQRDPSRDPEPERDLEVEDTTGIPEPSGAASEAVPQAEDGRASSSIMISYAKSLEGDRHILLPRVAVWSAVFEYRYENDRALRIYADVMPRVSEAFAGEEFQMESERFQLGEAFFFPLWAGGELAVTPKAGAWRYYARLPLAEGHEVVGAPFEPDRRLGVGVGATLAQKWQYVESGLSHSQDVTVGFLDGGSGAGGGRSRRSVFRLSIDGPAFTAGGRPFASTLSMFHFSEMALVTRTVSSPRGARREEFTYSIDFAGFGLGLRW